MKDQSLRVLMVEDSEDDELLLIRELRKGGYNTVYERVETAAAMKKALKEKQWDIILCDYKLPKFNVSSAIALLKETNIDIPVIIVSGSIGEEKALECMRLGAHDYIMKDNLSHLCPAIARKLEDAEVRNKKKQMEEKLRYEEQRFRAFIEHSSDIIVILNLEGIITYINPAIERVLGFKPEERIGATGFELVHSDDLVKSLTDKFIILFTDTNAPVVRFEMRLRHKDGSWRNVEAVGSNLVKNNVVESIVVNYRDITERKRAEKALRESESKYKSLIENIPDIIFTIDLEGKITFVSKRAKEITGYENAETINRNIFNFIPGKYHQITMENLQKGRKGEKINHIQMPVIVKSGEKLFFEFSFTRIYKDGVVSGAQGTAIDITDRKKAEETLRVWMYRYELIVAASGQVAYEYILCTGHITWGSSIEKVLGYTIKEISGGFIQWQKLLHPEDRETTMATLDAAQKTCTYWDTQYRLRHKIGKYLWIRDRGFFLPDSKGKAYCKLGMLEDITEHKLTDEIILQSEKRFKILYQESPIPTFTWQKKGDDFFLLDFNRAANLLTEGKAKKFKGISAREMHRKRPEIINDMLQCFNRKSTIGRELVSQYFAPGKSLSVYYSYIAPDLIIIHEQDITERKQMEEKLQNEQQELHAIMDASPIGVSWSDMQGNIKYANRKFQEIFGYTVEEIPNIDAWLLLAYPSPAYREHVLSLVNLHIEAQTQGKETNPVELTVVCKNGSIRHVLQTMLFTSNRILVIYYDITERKRADDVLQQTLDSLKKAVGTTIQALVSAVEVRDSYTAGHQLRSADLARAIATEMGLPQEKIDGIRMACSIHDIGKLSIPAEILSKPFKLTNIEFSLIKGHSQSGYEMLKDVESPWPLAQIVYQHHERIDGSGYPRNLKGNDILIEARIMAVADVVEAMASHRPYRPTLGIEAALEEIEKNKGSLYDNDVADACLRLFRKKGYSLVLKKSGGTGGGQ